MTVSLKDVRLSLAEFALEVAGDLAHGWTGLVGPSAAGKTSLLETIAGFRRPERGSMTIDGERIFDAGAGIDVAPRRRRIGYVTQDDTLFPHRRVRGNLAYGMHRAGRSSSKLEEIVSLLSLEPLLERRVGSLSGGEKRRVALARALLSGPRLLLLDEPLTGLDSASRYQVIASLKAIHAQFPIPTVYVAHHAEEVIALCDEALLLERGRIRRRDTPRAIFATSVSPDLRRGTSDPPVQRQPRGPSPRKGGSA